MTRLHLRYSKESLTDDLVFEAAEAVAGGFRAGTSCTTSSSRCACARAREEVTR